MHFSRFCLLASLYACLLPAMAQEPTAAPGDPVNQEMQQVVDVQGTRDPDLRPYRTMLKGLDAYADHQRLAPGAPLRFMLVPATPQARLDGVTLHLSADNHRQLWIPPGFAHGFAVMSESAEFLYKTTDYYNPGADRCIRWDDPQLAIDWGLQQPPVLSDKDKLGLPLAEAELLP